MNNDTKSEEDLYSEWFRDGCYKGMLNSINDNLKIIEIELNSHVDFLKKQETINKNVEMQIFELKQDLKRYKAEEEEDASNKLPSDNRMSKEQADYYIRRCVYYIPLDVEIPPVAQDETLVIWFDLSYFGGTKLTKKFVEFEKLKTNSKKASELRRTVDPQFKLIRGDILVTRVNAY